jgi:hypothetical protein
MKRLAILLFVLIGVLSACRDPKGSPDASTFKSAAAFATPGQVGPFVIPQSWKQANWYIDPQNTVSGSCASDNNRTCGVNNCSTPGDGPCLTYGSLATRWGTYFPRLLQNTIVFWLSGQTTDADPVYENPYIENQSYFVNQGTLTQICTGSLASVTALNRASGGNFLQASITGTGCASGVPNNTIIANTTSGKTSRAWTERTVSGTTYILSQPLTPYTVGTDPTGLTEVTTWANGDTFVAYSVTNVNFVNVVPVMERVNDTTANVSKIYLYQINAWNPGTSSLNSIAIGQDVVLVESSASRRIQVLGQNIAQANFTGGLFNADVFAGISVMSADTPSVFDTHGNQYPTFTIDGGITGSASAGSGYLTNTLVQLDPIFTSSGGNLFSFKDSDSNCIGLDGANIIVYGNMFVEGPGPNGCGVYGTGYLNVYGSGRIYYNGNTAVNTFTSSATHPIAINDQNTGCSSSGATTNVISCGISLTPSNLDLANTGPGTGFGNTAFIPGGATITSVFP